MIGIWLKLMLHGQLYNASLTGHTASHVPDAIEPSAAAPACLRPTIHSGLGMLLVDWSIRR